MTGDQMAYLSNIPQTIVSPHLIQAQLSRQRDIEHRDEDQPQ